jgi:hypothetical protein
MEMTSSRVIISPSNSRLLLLKPGNADLEEYSQEEIPHLYLPYSNSEIKSLIFSDGLVITRGDTIKVNNSKYKIQYIKKISDVTGSCYWLHTYILTRSFYFIMPALGGNLLAWQYQSQFCNCFVAVEGNEEYGEYIYLLYRFSGDPKFISFEQKIMNHSLYLDKKDVDKYHTLYRFNIPEKFKDDISLILEGKYSYTSPAYKERVILFHTTGDDTNQAVLEVLSRSEARRKRMESELQVTIPKDLDLMSCPNFIKETYSQEYVIKDDVLTFESI